MKLFLILFSLIITGISNDLKCADYPDTSGLIIQGLDLDKGNPANFSARISVDTVQVNVSTVAGKTEKKMTLDEILAYVGLVVTSLYEFLIRVIPTTSNSSILHLILKALLWISSLLNVKKKEKIKKIPFDR